VSVIDFHNHFYPPAYLEALRKGESAIRVTEDPAGNPVLHYPGDYNIAVPGHRDIAFREEEITRAGVDMQVLTFTSPGTHVEEPARAAAFARLVNDTFATIVRARPKRFTALATLPLNDVPASVRELERAVRELTLAGAGGAKIASVESAAYLLPGTARTYEIKRAEGPIPAGPAKLAVSFDDGTSQAFDVTVGD